MGSVQRASFAECELEGEEGGGELAWDGDGLARQVVEGHGAWGDEDGAVLVAHAGPAAGEGVLIGDIGVGVDGDGGDFKLAFDGALVEGLDVLEDVLEAVGAGGDFALGQGVEHEGVVGVGGVAEAEEHFVHGRSLGESGRDYRGGCGGFLRSSVDALGRGGNVGLGGWLRGDGDDGEAAGLDAPGVPSMTLAADGADDDFIGTSAAGASWAVDGEVELIAADTGPDGADGEAAGWAAECLCVVHFHELQESASLVEAVPALYSSEGGEEEEPEAAEPGGEADDGGGADEADDGGDHEASCLADDEPEERAEDLAAVEGVDGEEVEDEEEGIDEEDGIEEVLEVSGGGRDVFGQDIGDGDEDDVDERAGDDAPEGGAGALRGIDEGDAAEGPEEDAVGDAADGSAGEGVPELVEEDDEEEREVLGEGPGGVLVHVFALLELVVSDEEPGPVEGDVDTEGAEKKEGATGLLRVGHIGPG